MMPGRRAFRSRLGRNEILVTQRPPSGSVAAYLAGRTLFGVKLGLDTIRSLTEALDRPERSYPCIVIGGTNGKGSVTAYLDAALSASGLTVGRYTSPHLVHVRERIAVAGKPIRPRGFSEAVARVRDVAEKLIQAGRIPAHPTYFEVLTAAALWHFHRSRVDVALLEVGMGGRLDATNVCDPLLSVIVTIDLDHEIHLGTTLAEIATEKAGLLRPGRTTVLGVLPAEARAAIHARAREVGARLVDAWQDCQVQPSASGTTVKTPSREHRLGRRPDAPYQEHNLVVALRVLEECPDAGLDVDLDAAGSAVAAARWPGRLEWIPGEPPLLLDGAHNPSAARALAEYLRGLGSFVLLFGIMTDKDIEEVTGALFPLARQVVLTRCRIERAATTSEIARRAGGLAGGARRQASVRQALRLARGLAQPGEPVVVAGSLYLVGEVLRILRRRA